MTTPSSFDLSRALATIHSRVTDADREAQAKLNSDGRNLLSQKLVQNRIAIARAQEKAVLANLGALNVTTPASELERRRIEMSLDRLSELYAEQGRYAEAVDVTPNPERRKWFEMIKGAIDRDPAERCECPTETIINRKTNSSIRQSPFQKIANIYNPKTGRLGALHVCRACGFSNVI
jgi:hypothetical protein